MAELRWTGTGLYSDEDGTFVSPGETIEVDDERADELLSHWSSGWERVEDTDDSDSDSDSDSSDTDDPSDTDESEMAETESDDEDTVEPDSYSRDELEDMEWSDLRELASESDDPNIDGRSSKAEIIDALSDDESE